MSGIFFAGRGFCVALAPCRFICFISLLYIFILAALCGRLCFADFYSLLRQRLFISSLVNCFLKHGLISYVLVFKVCLLIISSTLAYSVNIIASILRHVYCDAASLTMLFPSPSNKTVFSFPWIIWLSRSFSEIKISIWSNIKLSRDNAALCLSSSSVYEFKGVSTSVFVSIFLLSLFFPFLSSIYFFFLDLMIWLAG
jgi:hypothetical protein